MTTLSRYVLKEHGWPFALGFVLILFILLIDVVLQTMDQVLSKGLALPAALQLLLFNLAWIVALAVPMAVLIAVLMAFARLAADGEIIAAKACGVSFWLLLRPVVVAAFLLTLLMVLFNDQILPDWNHQARVLSSSLQRTKAALVLREREGVFIPDLGDYHLLIRQIDPETNELAGIVLYDTSRPGPPVIVHAPRGRLALLGDGAYIRLELEEGHVQRVESSQEERFFYGTFARQVLHIKDERRRYEHRPSSYRSDRELDIAAMHRLVLKRRHEQERAYGRLDSIAARYLELHQTDIAATSRLVLERRREQERAYGRLDSVAARHLELHQSQFADSTVNELEREREQAAEALRRQWRHIDRRAGRINEYLVEIHKKLSIPAACLVFALVGAPLGALIRRRGAAVSVGISLFFFWIYWMFLIGGEELADRGYIPPPLAMWAPNLVFALAGWGLLRVVAYDRAGRRGTKET
ncbi:MAG: LptF/LptG family permease [Gemmatimonadetes bacterium]|nr:LptF/LptG family permease [Gemmatimonadota bacterium]MYI64093.1 LptF/LptG family permease [Gemmatimonadota bacterium]